MQIHFWPLNSESVKAAEHIRAHLGIWPAHSVAQNEALQLYTQWPGVAEKVRPGDWLILEGDTITAQAREAALREGALVLEVRIADVALTQAEAQPVAQAGIKTAHGDMSLDVAPPLETAASLLYQAMTLYIPCTSSTQSAQHYHFEGACTTQWQEALAAFLDCGFAALDALTLAYAWREIATEKRPIASNVNTRVDISVNTKAPDSERKTSDAGWPEQLSTYPNLPGQPTVLSTVMSPLPSPFASCPSRLGLYAVVPNADWVERVLAAGVRTVQLRIKKSTDPKNGADALGKQDILDIQRAIQVARAYNAPLFINDHWEYAIEFGAYGVHLGQEDLDAADLERIAAAGLRLGISTHGYYEILRAYQIKPSYIALGAVFPTTTKCIPTGVQGLDRLAHYVRLLGKQHMPLVAIGGIDHTVLEAVLNTGVGSAAVVRAITQAQNPEKAIAQLQSFFQ